jgi:hypothetical protein
MDRNGKGPNFPLQKTVIKVRLQDLGPRSSCLGLLSHCSSQQPAALTMSRQLCNDYAGVLSVCHSMKRA